MEAPVGPSVWRLTRRLGPRRVARPTGPARVSLFPPRGVLCPGPFGILLCSGLSRERLVSTLRYFSQGEGFGRGDAQPRERGSGDRAVPGHTWSYDARAAKWAEWTPELGFES